MELKTGKPCSLAVTCLGQEASDESGCRSKLVDEAGCRENDWVLGGIRSPSGGVGGDIAPTEEMFWGKPTWL